MARLNAGICTKENLRAKFSEDIFCAVQKTHPYLFNGVSFFKEAQLLCNYIDVKDSLTGRLAISCLPSLFVDQFEHSLRVCHLNFDKEAISNACRSENPGIGAVSVLDIKLF